MLSGLGLGTDENCPEASFPESLNYPGTALYYIVIVSMGTFSFFSFGTSISIFTFWKILLGFILRGKWEEAKQLVLDERVYKKITGSSGSKVFITVF